jgi:Uma2 family endonuclease
MTTLLRLPIPERPERRFTVQEYLRMIDAGILTKRDKVELIEGRIVEKMPTNAPHEAALQRVLELLQRNCPANWMVRAEATVQFDSSAPEPDVMVIRGPIDRYDFEHPRARDVLLIIEVSDSTLRADRGEMAQIYAGASIPFYWIVNLRDRRLEVHSNPTGRHEFPAYRVRQDVSDQDTVSLPFPEGPAVVLKVGDMFPRSRP